MSTWADLSALVNNDPLYNFDLVYNAAPFNYTNYTMKLYLKASRTSPDSGAVVFTVGSGLTATSMPLGQIAWTPGHANLLTPAAMWYHLDAVDSLSKVTTFFMGNFTVVAD